MPSKSKTQRKNQSPRMGSQNLSFVPYDNPETEFETWTNTTRTTRISPNQQPFIKLQQTQFTPYISPKKPTPPIPAPRTLKKTTPPTPAPRAPASVSASNTQFIHAANQILPLRPIPAPRTLKKHTPPKPAPRSLVSLRASNTKRKKTSPRPTQMNALMTLKFPQAPN